MRGSSSLTTVKNWPYANPTVFSNIRQKKDVRSPNLRNTIAIHQHTSGQHPILDPEHIKARKHHLVQIGDHLDGTEFVNPTRQKNTSTTYLLPAFLNLHGRRILRVLRIATSHDGSNRRSAFHTPRSGMCDVDPDKHRRRPPQPAHIRTIKSVTKKEAINYEFFENQEKGPTSLLQASR
jgi:hypothetical protein